jgi:membrane-bound lytic murein transglycosylase D
MLSLKMSKTIMVSSTLVFVTACTISYRNCRDAGNHSLEAGNTGSPFSQEQKVPLNKQAAKFVSDYIQKNNESLSKIRQNSGSSFRVMDAIFKKYRLPIELKYLAVVESELKPTAVSRVGATGPWQLMPETAKILGLKMSTTCDERTQYPKSTRAAAVYLRDLYSEFDDWLLVLAAYNSGPGPVYRAIRKSGSRNFWAMQYYLPAESRNHVKKFIATHYYFEGQGSETTLTKAENLDHANAMSLVMSGGVQSYAVNAPVKAPIDYAVVTQKSRDNKF